MIKLHFTIALFILGIALANADDQSHSPASKYAGQEKQAIKSLSADDIAELQRGGGWGLAKVAELNGVPGPIHLLEMKEEISLSELQIEKITRIYEEMRSRAIEQGEKLISLERALEQHFQDRSINAELLRKSLESIAEASKELRYIHLVSHLQTPKILTADQIKKYNLLRGYATQNPCDNIPHGHDPAMWRKHNGCE